MQLLCQSAFEAAGQVKKFYNSAEYAAARAACVSAAQIITIVVDGLPFL